MIMHRVALALVALLAWAGTAQAQIQTPSAVAAQRVPAGKDYFTEVFHNPLDYSAADDRRNAGLDDIDLNGVTVAGGLLSFITQDVTTPLGTYESKVWFLWPSMVPTYPEDGSGQQLPIDADTYHVAAVKMTCDNCPDPAVLREMHIDQMVLANFQWYNVGAHNEYWTRTQVFPVFDGTVIYHYDLKTLPLFFTGTQGSTWTGQIRSLLLSPANKEGIKEHLDWVTLTRPGTASVALDWGAYTGYAQVELYEDNNGSRGTHIYFARGDFAYPWGPDDCYRKELSKVARTQDLATVDVSMLAAGKYWLRGVQENGTEVFCRLIQVNSVPQVTVLQPDNRGDEDSDYALMYRNGDTWDMSSPSDFEVPLYVVNGQPEESINYGQASLVTNPTTSTSGTLSGTWLKHINYNPGAIIDDPVIEPAMTAPILTRKYRHLTVKMLVDYQRTWDQSPMMRVYWSYYRPVTDESLVTIGEDITWQHGVREMHINLDNLPVETDSYGINCQTNWANTIYARYFRIDPHELTFPVDSYIDYIMLTPNDTTVNGLFNITWDTQDADADGVTVSVYLDPDQTKGNGNEIMVASSLTANNWQLYADYTTGLPSGTYWVLLEYSDGYNTSSAYSSGQLDVRPLPRLAFVPMYRAYNPYIIYHFFTTSLNQFNNAVAAGYNNESTCATCRIPFYVANRSVPDSRPIYRLYNLAAGRHYYTSRSQERAVLMSMGWIYEGIEGYIYTVQKPGTSEVYKLYHESGIHLYTAKKSEMEYILLNITGWRQDASLGFAYASLASVPADLRPNLPADIAAVAARTPASPDELGGWSAVDALSGLTPTTAGKTASQAAQPLGAGALPTDRPQWVAADLDGDGRVELVGHDPLTGVVSLARLDGQSSELAQVADSAWFLAAAGDLNGDGRADLVWRHQTTGAVSAWLTGAGNSFTPTPLGQVSDLAWQLARAADLDGDGRADLVWVNPDNGQSYLWLMDGPSIKAQDNPSQEIGAGWELMAAADFNGDGRADLLWLNPAQDSLTLWLMKGTQVLRRESAGTLPSPAWRVSAAGDLDGDQKPDLVWRDGEAQTLTVLLSAHPGQACRVDLAADQDCVLAGDFNGDGKSELGAPAAGTVQLLTWLQP
ncbi:MAG: VCBS repeat-containing protein [Deltaproteobacteria bacterium]|nr:VCBS repeat-containing protein [Deltaproteobacteria bacterium]